MGYHIFLCPESDEVFATRKETQAYTRETGITDFLSIWAEVLNSAGDPWSIGKIVPNEPPVTEEMERSQAAYDIESNPTSTRQQPDNESNPMTVNERIVKEWLAKLPGFDSVNPRPGCYHIFLCPESGEVFTTREETQDCTRETGITDFLSIWVEVQNSAGDPWSIGKIDKNELPVTEEMERSQAAYDIDVALDADIERLERIEHEVTSRNLHPSVELAAWCNEKLAARYSDVVVHPCEDGDHKFFAKQFKDGTLMAQLLQAVWLPESGEIKGIRKNPRRMRVFANENWRLCAQLMREMKMPLHTLRVSPPPVSDSHIIPVIERLMKYVEGSMK